MEFTALIFLSLVAATLGLKIKDTDNRNETIECTFREFGSCFNNIATLGGNFTKRYDEKPTDLNKTCSMHLTQFSSCLNKTQQDCYISNYKQLPTVSILNFVNSLCTNKSEEQLNFLNSSVCYNQNINKRIECVKEHQTNKTDAKSLCCQSSHTQECLKSNMIGLCPEHARVFQNKLIDTYSSYTNLLCKPYEKVCNGATITVSSFLLVVLLTIVALTLIPL